MMSPEISTGSPHSRVLPHTRLHWTAEEIAVMKKCNQEGFYKRGLPLTMAFGYGTLYALKMGFLKPHVRYGSVPAVGIAGLIGCLVGSFSYKGVCFERVLALPNGTLKQQIENFLQQKPITAESSQFAPENMELDTETQMISGTQMESYQSTNSFDGFTGGDANGYQTSKINTAIPVGNLDDASISYDALRRKNRDDYVRSTSSRLPQGSTGTQPVRSETRVSEESQRFDRDSVPQYQLVD